MSSSPQQHRPHAPAPGLTRAQLIDIARTGDAYRFVPLAQRVLAHHPADDAIRFFLAVSYARLALREPALEAIRSLSAGAQQDADTRALAQAVEQLPPARIGLDELEATLTGNLDALADARETDPVDLRAHLPAWRERAGRVDWFRARDGNILRRRRALKLADADTPAQDGDRGTEDARGVGGVGGVGGEGGEGVVWEFFVDALGASSSAALPHQRVQPGQANPPYTFEGADPPWLLKRILDETPADRTGYRTCVRVVHEDPVELLTGLCQTDLSEHLRDPRVRVFVGDQRASAAERLRADLLGRTRTQILGPVLSVSTTRTKASPALEDVLRDVGKAQLDELQELLGRVGETYNPRTRAWYAERFADALDASTDADTDTDTNTGARLRVLIPTCRFSTYIKHASADLRESIRALGHEAELLIEPDDWSQMSALAHAEAFDRFEPDLVVLINYTRFHVGRVVPANVPFVCWVQDSMPHLLSEQAGASQGELDFTAGNTFGDLTVYYGYPRERSMPATLTASEAKFHPGPVASSLRDELTCDVCYVSHHSQTVEQMHAQKLEEARTNPGLVRALELLRPTIDRVVEHASDGPVELTLQVAAQEALRDALGVEPDPHDVRQIVTTYAMPMVDRGLRHQTLRWASAWCESTGTAMHIHGRGWGGHPELARYDRGELTHDDALRAAYACAGVHLHVSAHSVLHQRVVECLLSGGLALCRATFDLWQHVEHWAAVSAASCGSGPAYGAEVCDLMPRPSVYPGVRYVGFGGSSCAEAREAIAFRDLLGFGAHGDERDGFVWLNTEHLKLMDRGEHPGPIPAERNPLWLFSGLDEGARQPASDALFATREQLERLLVKSADPAWRERVATPMRERARSNLTTTGFARRLLRFVGSSLAEKPRA